MSSIPLAARIASTQLTAGTVSAWWLGGSGFIFKTRGGRQVWIDPYLSDCVRTIFGVGRAFPAPITVEEAEPDFVISTHWHEDHLDPEAIPQLARRRPSTKFVMPPSAMARALSWGIARERVMPFHLDETLDLGGVKITGIIARHGVNTPGWEVPDAVGVLFDFDGVKFFHSGDTEYDARIHRAVASTPVSIATFCINGSGGNMDAYEAALLAWHLDAKIVIPHHHNLWLRDQPVPGETLDPNFFADTYRKLGGKAQVVIPTIGAEILVR